MMAEVFKVLDRARGWEQHPAQVYMQYIYGDERDENPNYAALVAITDNADLAHWLIDAINACIEQVPCTSERPSGTVLDHGSFGLGEDPFLKTGRSYCVAFRIGSRHGSL
jgi:hypothetical protein